MRLVRWLLVLLLVWDQAGSPLHRHHHDSDIDGYALTASHDDGAADVEHLEDPDGDFHFSHAVMAVRPQLRSSTVAAGEAEGVVLAQAVLKPVHGALAARSRPLPWSDTHPPAHALHRSLPPAGRAPPLHA